MSVVSDILNKVFSSSVEDAMYNDMEENGWTSDRRLLNQFLLNVPQNNFSFMGLECNMWAFIYERKVRTVDKHGNVSYKDHLSINPKKQELMRNGFLIKSMPVPNAGVSFGYDSSMMWNVPSIGMSSFNIQFQLLTKDVGKINEAFENQFNDDGSLKLGGSAHRYVMWMGYLTNIDEAHTISLLFLRNLKFTQPIPSGYNASSKEIMTWSTEVSFEDFSFTDLAKRGRTYGVEGYDNE